MPDVSDAIQDAIGEVFDTLRDGVLLDTTDTLTLLTQSETEDEYDKFFEIEGRWLAVKLEGGKRMRIQIAARSDDLSETFANSTHFRFNNDVYAIADADVTSPDTAGHFMWTFVGEKRPTRGNYVEMW
jgi:hypothetical protein